LKKALALYKKGGATALSAAIKKGTISSISTDRRDFRVGLLKDAVNQEALKKPK
jgi:hypothetical protein